ncbi:MAG: 3-oxoadipate enol-lactonase [Thermodesulfobacteriota bacterium]
MPVAEVNQTRLNYQWEGPAQGQVVMLCNSLASNLGMWDMQVQELVQAGYQVLRYDTRGHGESDVPEAPYSMEMLLNDVIGLLDYLQLERVHFCGLSLGGMLGQMLGIHYPQRLNRLLLCSTAAYLGPPEMWEERMQAARSQGMQPLVQPSIDRWFTQQGQKRLPEQVQKFKNMIQNTPVEGFCGCCAAIRDMDLREAISGITIPTMVVAGELDQGTPVSEARFIQERIPGAGLEVIPQTAHMLNVEQAERFNSILLEFLRSKA